MSGMKCERCHEREATVLIRALVNGRETEQRLCAECAAARQQDNYNSLNSFFGGGIFGNLFGQTGGLPSFSRQEAGLSAGPTCSKCGMTYDQFRKNGLLGCAHCYEEFRVYLENLFTRIQRGPCYVGRNPSGAQYPPAVSSNDQPSAERRVDAAPSVITEEAPAKSEIKWAELSVDSKLEELRKQQEAAVAKEDYEEAARLRDAIHEIKQEKGDVQ
ncbi:MAG: UvrB/UvrC motif-containing protein [Fastidiosipilaceae bacterium]|jgi:protein arginine kinase activator